MIVYVLFIIAVFFFVIALHEMGHMISFTYITKRKVKLRFNFRKGFMVGSVMDYQGLTNMQYSAILLSGIVAGMIPLLAFDTWVSFALSFFVYIVLGCRSDFINLFKTWMVTK